MKLRYEYVRKSGRLVSLPRFVWRRLPAERRRVVMR